MEVSFAHAGIATTDATALAAEYAGIFDCPIVHEEQTDGMYFVFLELKGGYLEVIEPIDGGPIAEYLDEDGPGLHHLALATDDITAALDRAREHGVALLDEQPRPGAWGHDVAFLHPASTGGVLFEFVDSA